MHRCKAPEILRSEAYCRVRRNDEGRGKHRRWAFFNRLLIVLIAHCYHGCSGIVPLQDLLSPVSLPRHAACAPLAHADAMAVAAAAKYKRLFISFNTKLRALYLSRACQEPEAVA